MTANYSGRKILFTAFSLNPESEEMAAYEYVKRHGGDDISALFWGDEDYANKIPNDVKKIPISGNNGFESSLTEGYDLVFRHQTTRPELIKSPITTGTVEFFTYCPAPIIGVTGTKGKGTTTTLISRILEEAGYKTHLVGNIGNPALTELDDIAADDIVVFEISSFQSWDLKVSPHVAVVLMIDEDHLDVHRDVAEYIEAKSQVVVHQGPDDLVTYHPTNEMTAHAVGEPKSRTKKYLTDEGANIVGENIVIDGQEIMRSSEIGLIGAHNFENVCAAITAAWEYTRDVSVIRKAVAAFTGLPHRLEYIATIEGVDYINDSFSSSTPAAEAAVQAFDRPAIAILGGYDKFQSFNGVAQAAKRAGLKHAVLIGDIKNQVADELKAIGFEDFTVVEEGVDMSGIVEIAKEKAEDGDVIVLSPGSASFDMFESYKARGKEFVAAVEAMKNDV